MPNWVALPPVSLFSVPQKVTRDKKSVADISAQTAIITGHSTALGYGLRSYQKRILEFSSYFNYRDTLWQRYGATLKQGHRGKQHFTTPWTQLSQFIFQTWILGDVAYNKLWGPCLMAGFATVPVETSCSAAWVLVSKIDLRGICCVDGWWIELAQDRVQWRDLVIAVLNLWVLVPES
jgi:hypothetical protein